MTECPNNHQKHLNVQKNSCLSEVFTYHRGSHPELLEQLFCKIQQNSLENIRIGVFLVLDKKSTPPLTAAVSEIIWESHRDGFLLYRCSRSKMLEQLFRKIREKCQEKIHGSVLFKILANKPLHYGQFPGNFLEHFRTAILQNTSGKLFVKGFLFYPKQSPESVKKTALKNLKKVSRKRPQEYIFFKNLANRNTVPRMALQKFVKCFK